MTHSDVLYISGVSGPPYVARPGVTWSPPLSPLLEARRAGAVEEGKLRADACGPRRRSEIKICKTASVDIYKAVSVEFFSILLQRHYPDRTPKNECVNQLSKSLVA